MVTPRFAPFVGGVETHTLEVSRRLAAAGVNVKVVTTDPTGALERRETVEGVQVYRVGAWPRQGDWYLAPGMVPFIQPSPHRVIHCQGFHTLVAPLALLAAQARAARRVLTFHSGGHSTSWREAIRPVQTAAIGPLLRRADALVAVSEFEASLFARRLGIPRERVHVIPNGSELPAAAAALAPEREDLVVSVGRLERYKGHHRVIAALPTVAARVPSIRLEIIGSGPFEAALREVARTAGVVDRVTIRSIPTDRRDALGDLLRRARLVTLLSSYESQGISVVEALAAGAPVLAADTSALGEMGARGWITTTSLDATDQEIGEAIVRAIQSPISVAPPALPTWDETADRLHRLYRAVLASARGDAEPPGSRTA